MPKRLPSWANKAAVRELRRAAVLSLEFDGADDLAALIGDARRLLAFLLAASSRDAANMRLEIFSRTPGASWSRRIALAAELCRYVEERRAA